jgi:hypothetical protein
VTGLNKLDIEKFADDDEKQPDIKEFANNL